MASRALEVSGNDNKVLVGDKCIFVTVTPTTDESPAISKESTEPEVNQISSKQVCTLESSSLEGSEPAGWIMSLLDSVRNIHKAVIRHKIDQSVQTALSQDIDQSPRVKGPNTVLCLDCSRHMTAEGYEDMKKLAHSFVNSVDERAVQEGVEQNIAVVCMSGGATVLQHLTIDLNKVREAIDNIPYAGKSTYFEAILVSLAALDTTRKIGVIPEGSKEDVAADMNRSRIIFITCGKPSVETSDESDDTILPADLQMRLFCLVKSLRESTELGEKPQMVWIPTAGADMKFLDQISRFGGEVVKGKDINTLA